MNKYDVGIWIFRNDLRIVDNKGLSEFYGQCTKIIPIFIFDPVQMVKNNINKNYLSYPALKFICECVKSLYNDIFDKNGHLNIYHGKVSDVLKSLINILTTDSVTIGFNEDYTKYSLVRDALIQNIAITSGIYCTSFENDTTLINPNLLIKNDGAPYVKFGSFRQNFEKHDVNTCTKTNILFSNKKYNTEYSVKNIDIFWKPYLSKDVEPVIVGGRKNGLKILSNIRKFDDYENTKDLLSENTTKISAHLNFGSISVREFYFKLLKENNSKLINQLIWKDFYFVLNKYDPSFNNYNNHSDKRFNNLPWKNTNDLNGNNKNIWNEWYLMMESKTGFLLIDAAIQEIKKTGFMHGRSRLLVGIFSVKYLLINPLCRYYGLNDWFSRYLSDCITTQNKLNCQFITELDYSGKKFSPKNHAIAGRFMSISNTMIKKYDPECIYIKKWLPWLSHIDNKILCSWDTHYDEDVHCKPMFDFRERYAKWINMCKN